jgi:hypothetical protein
MTRQGALSPVADILFVPEPMAAQDDEDTQAAKTDYSIKT